MSYKRIFYLRTDICDTPLIAGGSVAHTLGVIEGFLALGFEVLCASSLMHEALQSLKLYSLYTLSNPRLFTFLRWKLNCVLSNIFFTIQSLNCIKDKKIDFIYQRYSILNCSGVLLSKIKKVNLILEYNGSEIWVETFWTKKHWLSLKFLIRWFEYINLKYAYLIVVVSQPLKEELMARGIAAKKILVNPNGVNTAFFNPNILENERTKIRKKLAIEDCFVFGFIGTFSQWHGIEMLAAIIPEILAQKMNVHFLLIGDGPLFTYFHSTMHAFITAKKITCTGLIPQHLSREYLAACDAFLSPTQPNPDGTPFFGSPTKIFEYLSMGKPIIASNLDQLGELINPAFGINDIESELEITEQIGFALPATNKEAFIKAAHTLLTIEKNNHIKMGTLARQKALEKYEWKQHVNNIISHIA